MGDEIDTSGPTTIVAPDGMRLVVNGLVLHGRSSYEAQPGDTVSVVRVPTARTTLRELAQAVVDAPDDDEVCYALGDWLGYPRDSRQYVPERVARAILAALDAERDAAERSKRFTEEWHAERWARLHDLGSEMSETTRQRMHEIMANGTCHTAPDGSLAVEPPTYARILARKNWEIERLQNALEALPARSGSGTEAARDAATDNAPETEAP